MQATMKSTLKSTVYVIIVILTASPFLQSYMNSNDAYGQENATMEKAEMDNSSNATMMTSSGTIPPMSTHGAKAFYLFTTEIPNID